jgi:hypothetical protein
MIGDMHPDVFPGANDKIIGKAYPLPFYKVSLFVESQPGIGDICKALKDVFQASEPPSVDAAKAALQRASNVTQLTQLLRNGG